MQREKMLAKPTPKPGFSALAKNLYLTAARSKTKITTFHDNYDI